MIINGDKMIKELENIIPKEKQNNPYGFNNYYGVRLPELRKIAKTIIKEKRYDFFNEKHTSFEELTQEKITLLTNHINSVKRDSLNRHSPFELSQLLLDSKIHEILHLEAINPDEVNLTPELLK